MSRTALTIGNFDGVHLGHAALIAAARESAGADGRVVALAFDPHPRSVLRPGSQPQRLTTFDQRAALLGALGVDEVRRLEPDRRLLSLSAEAFIEHVVRAFAPAFVVEGPDFHFGNQRRGDAASLAALGERHGFVVRTVPGVEVDLQDQSVVTASSTIARWLLAHGRVDDAARVLGRPYELAGEVVPGDRRGRAVGFPTVNLAARTVCPAPGVYAAYATLPGGDRVPAAVNIGARPTFGGADVRVEAHLLGLSTSWRGAFDATPRWAPIDGLREYGWACRLGFVRRLRDELRFGSVDALTAQLARDCQRTLAACGRVPEAEALEVGA